MNKLLLLVILFTSFTIISQEVDFFSDDVDIEDIDFDSMFSLDDETLFEEIEDESDQVADPSSDLLVTKGLEWGGTFLSSITAGLTFSDFPDSYDDTFTPELFMEIHFNSRPTEDSRFFGKISTEIPFTQSANALVENPQTPNDEDSAVFANVSIPKIVIEELFSDFNYDDKLYFRVGKQNASWGVGYFFSPADFLSLESIDPEDPTADREGPIAIKLSIPFGLNNFYTFITVPNAVFDSEDASVSDLIVAPMIQFLVGQTEISSGIYYQKDSSPRAMVSGTYGTNTDIGQFSFFSEAVGLWGSDKIYVSATDDSNYTLKTFDNKLFFNGTVGFMWSKEIADNNFSIAAQYLYNGEGYRDGDVLNLVVADYIMGNTTDLEEAGFSYSDIKNRGMHYLGANFSISDLFTNEDLSLSAFMMMNLSDISGFVKPSLSYSLFHGFVATLGATFNFSDMGDELYSDIFALELSFNLGSGSF